MKRCCTCKVEKPFTDFHLQKGKPRSQCKVCANEYQRTSKKRAEYLQRWREGNREKIAVIQKKYRDANRELSRAQCREWGQRNKDKVRAAASLKRAIKARAYARWSQELTDFVTSEACLLAAMREQATKIAWHVDHIVPLKGVEVCGLHVWNNLRVVPAVVNISKKNRFNEGSIQHDLYRMGW